MENEQVSSDNDSIEDFPEKWDQFTLTACGGFCNQCQEYAGNKIGAAEWLLLRTAEWITDYAEDEPGTGELQWREENGFDLKEFVKGLRWFFNMRQGCSGCRECSLGIVSCVNSKGLTTCLTCEQFHTCEKIRQLREKYPYWAERYQRVQQVGVEQYVREEESLQQGGQNQFARKQIPWESLFEAWLASEEDVFELWVQHLAQRSQSAFFHNTKDKHNNLGDLPDLAGQRP